MKLIILPSLIVGALAGVQFISDSERLEIGATEVVVEANSGLPFVARVDTGAHSCSIHSEAIKIEDESDDPLENIGKPVTFLVKNKKGQSEWISAEIVDYVVVRTSERAAGRYKVKLPLSCRGVTRDVQVTLNDRANMRYSMLLGRNFLRGHFVVALD